MISLALAYLRDRPLTTALNLLLLAIAVAMLVLLVQVSAQASARFDRDAQGVDLVVGAKGSPLQLILSSIFHVDQPTGNIPLEARQVLERDPSVARVVPLALGDNFGGYRIVGTDAGFAALYGLKTAEGRSFAAPMEAVLGAEVARETGAELGQKFIGSHGLAEEEGQEQGHDHAPFTTVGILAPTGGVTDRLILTSIESVWQVHGIEEHHEEGERHDNGEHHEAGEEHDHHDEDETVTGSQSLEPELTALLVTYRNAAGAMRVPTMINRQSALQAAVPATETARLLDLLGASLEGVLTALVGTVLGWTAAHCLIMLARANFPALAAIGLTAWAPLPMEAAVAAAVVGIGALAALVPALAVYRLDPARVLARASASPSPVG
jgi:putative ABC transport system permease protein